MKELLQYVGSESDPNPGSCFGFGKGYRYIFRDAEKNKYLFRRNKTLKKLVDKLKPSFFLKNNYYEVEFVKYPTAKEGIFTMVSIKRNYKEKK